MNYLKVMTGVKQSMAIKSKEPYSRDIRTLKTTSNMPTIDILFMPTPKKTKHVKLTESAFGRWR